MDHILAVALQAGLDAGIIEQLPDHQAGLLWGVLSKFVEVDHQLIGLVELESDVPQLRPRLACLGLLLHEGAHEGHLAHAWGDGGDDQGWSEEFFVWDDHFADIGLQFVLDPQGEAGQVVGGHRGAVLFLFLLFLPLLLLHALEDAFDICGGVLDVGEFEAFVGFHLVEDELFDGGVGDEDGDAVFGEGVDVGIVGCDCATRCGSVEDDVLGVALLGHVVLQTEIPLLCVHLVPVQLDHLLAELWVQTALLHKDGKGAEPFDILLGVFLCLVFDQFNHSFCQEVSQLGHEGAVLEGFSWDVQGDVFAIDHSLHEPEEAGEEDFFAIFFDEHSSGVETDLAALLLHAVPFAVGLGNIENCFECQRHVRAEVEFVLVALASAGEKLKESLVLLLWDFWFRADPYGFDEVDCLSVDGDGEIDEIWIFLHDLLYLGLLHKLPLIFLDMQHDPRPPRQPLLFYFLDLVCAAAVGGPFVGRSARLPRDDLYQIADYERRVKSHAELPDDVVLDIGGGVLVLAESLYEFFGAWAGDGAEEVDEGLSAHADAVVLDDQLSLRGE